MSASTQASETNRTNGNGHSQRKPRSAASIAAQKATAAKNLAAKKAAAPVQRGQTPASVAAPPVPGVTPIPIAAGGPSMISLTYLRDRLTRLEIERQTIQSLISAAGSQRVAAPRKAMKKRRAKRLPPMKQAA